MANDVLRAEHDQVLQSLATRESTRQFAHAAVSLFVSIITLSTAGKLWWDFADTYPEAWMAAAGVSGLALSYALVRLTIGLRHYREERAKVTRLIELRRTLGLDAGASTGA